MHSHSRPPDARRVAVEVDGHEFAADLHLGADSRPPVVFLHGLLASLSLAPELFVDPVAESWLAVSLPGHHPGRFPADSARGPLEAAAFADLFEAVLDKLVGDRRVVVAGWSTGGFAALNLAIRHPQRVAAVACLSGFARGRCSGCIGWLQWLADGAVGRPFLVTGLRVGTAWQPLHDLIVRQCTADRAAARRVPAAMLARMFRDFADHDPAALASVLAAVRRIDIAADLAAVRVPTWIACGERDPVVPLAEARLLAASIPDATLTVYPDAGHLFFSEWPRVREDFAAWRDRVSGQDAAGCG
jgi:pimeloyl-ACP methyl ester carboxylesterase